MENIIEHYRDKNIFMVGALDSMGVPYTIDNDKMTSFVDLTALELKKQGLKIEYVNLCSLGRNKTWELEEILKRDYTVSQYNKLNKLASEFVISGKRKEEDWPYPTNPKFVEEYYKRLNVSNPDTHITSELKYSESPIFLYSCGGMNIRSYLKIKTKMNLQDVLVVTKEVLLRAMKHVNQTKNDVENCIEYISKLNPNIQVYVLGVYAMLDDQKLRDIVFPFVEWYNYELRKIISKYDNVHYVDIKEVKNMVAEKDMHPNLEGQEYITKQMIKTMNNSCKE